jgi:hypothetical protein
MPGFMPGIHVFPGYRQIKAWMIGSPDKFKLSLARDRLLRPAVTSEKIFRTLSD